MAPTTQTAPTATQQSSPPQETGFLHLNVPYFSQRDSATWQGHRMCFSSTCAMAAAFLRPGCLEGAGQPDDRYLALVERFGDTTNAAAQVQALERLGIQATFRTDGCIEQLIAQLRLGIPIPVGWLHRGPASAPTGGGHWSLVVGWDPRTRQVLMHDPNGEADLVRGGYVSTAIGSGKSQRYSERNWGRRWMVEAISLINLTSQNPGSRIGLQAAIGYMMHQEVVLITEDLITEDLITEDLITEDLIMGVHVQTSDSFSVQVCLWFLSRL